MLPAEVYPRSANHVHEVAIVASYQVLTLHLFENVAEVGIHILVTGQFLFLTPARLLCLAEVLVELYLQRLMLIEPVVLRNLVEVCVLWSFGLVGLLPPQLLANPNQLGPEDI